MLIQPLLDKLVHLRLPAFRDGLQEQLGNPKYAELAFEERLALLVDRNAPGAMIAVPSGESSWPTSPNRLRLKTLTFPQSGA